eukprot:11189967-Lingulodinium_polyedra.AAC.1
MYRPIAHLYGRKDSLYGPYTSLHGPNNNLYGPYTHPRPTGLGSIDIQTCQHLISRRRGIGLQIA